MRYILAMIALFLAITALPAQNRVGSRAEILVVAGVDKPNGRILFDTITYERQTVERDGKSTTEFVPVLAKAAFSLKEGKAITAGGKAVKEEDLWKRIEPGKPVVILSPDGRDSAGELDKSIRALFKEDTVLLVGTIKPLPQEKEAPKKP
jgi:hypothetical protein